MSDVTREAWAGCFGGADTSDNGAADCLAFKGMAMVTVTLPDGTGVDVYNLHAEAGSSPEDQALQREDFTQLAAFIEASSAGRAVILGGDTNLHTDEEPENPQDVEDTGIWQELLETTGLPTSATPSTATSRAASTSSPSGAATRSSWSRSRGASRPTCSSATTANRSATTTPWPYGSPGRPSTAADLAEPIPDE